MLSPGQKKLQRLLDEEAALLDQVQSLQEDGGALNVDGTTRKIPTSPKEELEYLLEEERKLQLALNTLRQEAIEEKRRQIREMSSSDKDDEAVLRSRCKDFAKCQSS